jgi:hypothetical protein
MTTKHNLGAEPGRRRGMNDTSRAPCWVPWPEREPPRGNTYLVFMRMPYQWEVAYYDGDWYPSAGDSDIITHWMHLPPAPGDDARGVS